MVGIQKKYTYSGEIRSNDNLKTVVKKIPEENNKERMLPLPCSASAFRMIVACTGQE